LTRRFAEEDRGAPYFIIWRGDGEVLKASKLPPSVSATEQPLFPGSGPGLHLRQRGRLREVVLLGPRQTQILVGRSTQREHDELAWLAWQLVMTGAGVLAVGLAGGWLLSSRAVRPIAAMSAAAASISASNLSRRIDVAEVDSELGKLASILNEMFARLQTAFARQVRFTADASHELRTPLAIIHARAELTLTRPRGAEEYREALETCLRASRRMRSLVDGLLTLARADAGKLELKPQPLDLGALVRETVTLLEPLAEEKNVTLSVNAPSVTMRADSDRLAQVVTNLTANAIHYNRPGGNVWVTLEATESEAVLTVTDTGVGIPEEDRPHLFERFYRVDKARSREEGGNGLGLAICHSIVEALGGSIGFTTEVDRGTTFTVRLPRELPGRRGE
jgi:heavy metal sensor kinase